MRGLIGIAVAAVAVVLQLAVADRIAFPGGTGPDLVLLTVAALALATGPMAGALIGFCAGLALDVAPPAGHYVGQDALVFCLIGYACGLVATAPSSDGVQDAEHTALFELGVTAAGAVCGEAMIAALGVMLSDPRVTWPAIKHVLPFAVGYDLLLTPFVLFAVAAMLRVAAQRDTTPSVAPRRAAWAAASPATGALRQMAGGSSPRLRLSGQGKGEARLGGARGGSNRPGPGRPSVAGRGPRLKLGRGGSPSGMPGSAFAPGGARRGGPARRGGLPTTAKVRFGTRRGEGVVGGSLLGGSTASGRAATRLASSRLGASLLGGSVFGRSSAPFCRSPALLGRGAGLSGGFSGGLAGGGLAGGGRLGLRGTARTHTGSGPHAPRFRKAGTLTRLSRGLRRPGQRKSPGKRWLRASSPGRGSVRSAASRGMVSKGIARRSPGRGWLRRSGRLSGSGGSTGLKGLGLSRRSSGLRLSRRSSSLGRRGGPRLGRVGGGSARLGMGRTKLKKKSWRRTGGLR